jgi:hypothetical protein
MARLDRLGPVTKEVAQSGAAIGREFGFGLLASVADLPERELREALDRLTNAGLLFVRGTPPDAVYTFKHALVQDVAYGSLLRNKRGGAVYTIVGAPSSIAPSLRGTAAGRPHCPPSREHDACASLADGMRRWARSQRKISRDSLPFT